MVISALILLAIFVGACSQRITGMGFALVSAPFLVLLLGPFPGVMVVNLCGIISSGFVLSRVWRSVEWKTCGWLVMFAVIGIIPGAWLASVVHPTALEITIGGLLIVALSISILASKFADAASPTLPNKMAAGFLSGAMNAAAGVGGPAVSVYAVATRWEQRAFAATLQPYLLVVSVLSLTGKLILEPTGWPTIPIWLWASMLGVLMAGVFVGDKLSHRVSPLTARRILIVLAYAGALATLIKGLVSLG
ncbi:sulfite exporter TauE/SafE family protein [Saxibacter everestensis]|uniref:Probable membrane transporter protein n=1 Tax=Saxibacter everestensis TaxID=2909229 RepID=A0ABY8QUL5_9MICO|nr:sulfite exporter TauE/SafE family protein [Brevibacteriaceae bacterium ZFBP1038]